MEKKRKPAKEPGERRSHRALWITLAVVLAVLCAVATWYLIRYQFYGEYRQYVQHPAAREAGSAFAPIQEDAASVPGFELAAQNDAIKLYVKPATGEIALYDLRSGRTVYSNPQDADSDAAANQANKNYLKSQFQLDYYNANLTAGTFDSYSMSAANDQIQAESIENGVRFIYTVGEKEVLKYLTPSVFTVEKFEALRAVIPEKDMASITKIYELSEDGTVYQMNAQGLSNVRNCARADKVLRAAGFTEEDYWEQQNAVESGESEKIGFTVTLEYRLTADGVEVTVPVSEIEERGGAVLTRIQLLRFLGAADNTETGYMVVPNGSGSLIRFNNGKSSSMAYSQFVYGMDDVDADYTKLQNTMPIRLPIFGVCREGGSILATIERGATLASLQADVAGRGNSYNYVYPAFTLRGASKLAMFGATGGGDDVTVVERDMYQENLTVRYTLLNEDYAGYAGLARYYRERLISEGRLTPKAESGDIPFFYDVIGGVKETAHVLGVQYLHILPMTTFKQAQEMAQTLKKAGITNQAMNLQGWMNGGYYHDVVDRVSVLWELGGKEDLAELDSAMTRLGGALYGDATLQSVTSISKRYLPNAESARYYGAGYTARLGQLNPASLRRTTSLGYDELVYDLMSPKFLPRYVKGFASSIKNLSLTGISLRDLGDELHADKRRTEVISREAALDVVRAMLGELQSTGKQILVSGGNDYALGVASGVINAPMSATEYFILDDTVPLYQMVLHGCVDYAGIAANTSVTGSTREAQLKLIEYGAAPHYVFTWEESTAMKYTGLNRFSSTTFATWADTAIKAYQYVNGALSSVSGAAMTAHDELAEGVVRVSYDNGVRIYVNYGGEPATVDGQTVPAQDYLTVGGVNE